MASLLRTYQFLKKPLVRIRKHAGNLLGDSMYIYVQHSKLSAILVNKRKIFLVNVKFYARDSFLFAKECR